MGNSVDKLLELSDDKKLTHYVEQLLGKLENLSKAPEVFDAFKVEMADYNYLKPVQNIIAELGLARENLKRYQQVEDIDAIKKLLTGLVAIPFRKKIIAKTDIATRKIEIDSVIRKASSFLDVKWITQAHDQVDKKRLARHDISKLTDTEVHAMIGMLRPGNMSPLGYIVPYLQKKYGYNSLISMMLDILQCHLCPFSGGGDPMDIVIAGAIVVALLVLAICVVGYFCGWFDTPEQRVPRASPGHVTSSTSSTLRMGTLPTTATTYMARIKFENSLY